MENVCLNLPLANPDQAMEFRNGFALKDGQEMPYAENKILIEFGYTMNNNKPPVGYTCCLPVLLPRRITTTIHLDSVMVSLLILSILFLN